MITNEVKKELFRANLKVIEGVIAQLTADIKDAQGYLEDKSDSDQYNLNVVMGTLHGMPHKLKQIEDIRNVLESVHRIK
jgi:hypothetical protein